MRKERVYPIILLAFLLGIRDGYITLWKQGDPEPVRQFCYKAENLPEPDQRALEQGIPINNPRHLTQILEDYLS